jgi:hypothetical protein
MINKSNNPIKPFASYKRSSYMLKNGSFTEGWKDVQAPYGYLINQEPNGWNLRWLDVGEDLFGSGDKATGVPECVHKLAKQLPANEQLGAANALILEGDATYKIFNSGAAFGAELSQTVTGLQPGSQAALTVPVLVVLYNDADPYAAESGLWVNGEGHWVNSSDMGGSRKWYHHERNITVPANGTLEIVIRVKSKWPAPKDFFIDGVKLDAVAGSGGATTAPPTTTTPPVTTAGSPVLRVGIPAGMQVITTTSSDPNVVVISIPAGTQIEYI